MENSTETKNGLGLVSMRNICKSFDGTMAVKDGQLDIAKGEIHALIGENGAGKSTLVNVLCGVLRADSGSFVFDGREGFFRSIGEAKDAGVFMIYQELNVIKDLTVAQNIFFGKEPKKGLFITAYCL